MLKFMQKIRKQVRSDECKNQARPTPRALMADKLDSNFTDCESFPLIIASQIFVETGFGDLKCNVFLSQLDELPSHLKPLSAHTFTTEDLHYEAFCDDFGPMNLISVTEFISTLDHEIVSTGAANIVYRVAPGTRNLTNGAFLLGAYMILKLNLDPQRVAGCFTAIENKFEGYRDATFCVATFRLQLMDCWKGLHHAKSLKWIAMPSSEKPSMWGQIDVTEYEQYDDYLNGDLHTVVPGRFVAFRGPKHVQGHSYKDNYDGQRFVSRDFTPQYYSEIFESLGVSTVVRLNEATYPKQGFAQNNIEHFDLFFEDCSCPPSQIVASFFDIIDRASGLVAIHCKAGLGRTGTLIALSLIRSHGFSAREAMGWLRIMRPGSVIGDQQEFLCAVESCLGQRTAARRLSQPCLPPPNAPPSDSAAGAAARPRRQVRFLAPTRAGYGSLSDMEDCDASPLPQPPASARLSSAAAPKSSPPPLPGAMLPPTQKSPPGKIRSCLRAGVTTSAAASSGVLCGDASREALAAEVSAASARRGIARAARGRDGASVLCSPAAPEI